MGVTVHLLILASQPSAALSVVRAVSPTAPISSSSSEAMPLQLLSTTPQELRAHFGWPVQPVADKVRAVWGALRRGIDVLDEDEAAATKYLSPRLLRQLQPECAALTSAATLTSTLQSSDGTQKLLLTLTDGLSVECVLIPISGKHTSLCVSSQVGCSRACAFCSTGTMGLVRSLTTEEICHQVWRALRIVREQALPPLVNVVFMGMGEPLNNLDAVIRAVTLLVAPDAFALSRRNVCVSTVGPSPKLIARAAEILPCRLAWSVHASDDDLRKLLVPTTRHSMETLRDAFIAALASKPGGDKARGLLVELALMRDINDQPEHAEHLARLLHPFGRGDVLVNLIPYNENGLSVGGSLIRQSSAEDVYSFQQAMWNHGILCTVRATRGDDDRAACGQLATEAGAKGRRREAATVVL